MIKSDPYAALQVRDFRLFILSRLFITLAIQIQGGVVGWQIYELTKDPLSLGLIGLAEAIPAITVSLYAGHLADIIERKKIILTCVGLLALCSRPCFISLLTSGRFFCKTAPSLFTQSFL